MRIQRREFIFDRKALRLVTKHIFDAPRELVWNAAWLNLWKDLQ